MARTLLWFKNDLRLDDHPAVALAATAEQVLPVYILDPRTLRLDNTEGRRGLGVHRTRFLLEGLAALDGELRQRGSQLLVLQGNPERIIAQLVDHFDFDEVLTLDEVDPAARAQLNRLRQNLGPALQVLPGDGLFDNALESGPISAFNYTTFREQVEALSPTFHPQPARGELPPLPAGADTLIQPLPTLSQLGLGEPLSVASSAFPFSGGEPAAQARLQDYFWLSGQVGRYHDRRQRMFGTDSSSKLAPWLAQGSLSARRVAAELQLYEAQFGRDLATQGFWQELLWREFFRHLMLHHGKALFAPGRLKATSLAPRGNDERFIAWRSGTTGLPLVDACMRELLATGYLSNRGRRIVASYLIRDLQQDWRLGATWFEEHLLDYEPASNWGNWALIASAVSHPQRAAGFNVLHQARHYDPDAEYVALWLPELRRIPAVMRHTPFLLPALQLEALRYPKLQNIPQQWQPFMPRAA